MGRPWGAAHPITHAGTSHYSCMPLRSCREVFNELPLEFAAEVNELMSLKLEGSVG